ncbi:MULTISPECIES: HigA family addiction module antitoxin [Bacillus]|uniref:HigA family addiction module antitoxin n=1 Tax=Bacillus TaxID=1386 RepID=UPI000DF74991|nr:HigA family addiction module antitoxin [Bacillus subtilis]MBG8574086.1 DNA-binding protein [Bacillus subtilis]MBG9626037.1 DNA-binding protein [Bacillus subtilis]MBW9314851.1 HigA family addiction module antidote protein [Bacillus subtilis]MED1805708.1 HigA family addiction module antitoxin [Bacillus subtilis]RDB50380.1 addiction module antidote protein, HigA family [Bacillus subtilis subsp. subtilis]
MGNEFIVHTGSVIKEYLEEIGMSTNECAKRLGVSENDLSNLLSGKSRLTEEMALNLEKIFKGIPASYWLNYDRKYQEYQDNEVIHSKTYKTEDLNKLSKRFRFNTVFNGLGWNLTKQASEMLKLLKIDNFEQFDTVYSKLNVDFMEDGGETEAIAIWLNLAREEVEIQNKDLSGKEFSKEKLIESLGKFKSLSLNNDYESSLKSARKLLNRLGIYLVFLNAIENSKVRGALTTYKEKPAIFLSGRFKTHDHVWFALMHEIGHLIKHYIPNEPIVTLENELEDLKPNTDKKEEEANEFARDFFIDKSEYKKFVESRKFDEHSIYEFANAQSVLPGIVLARLQHDGYVSFDKLNHLKKR